jgi:uncharacterized protein YndB with AHSA1/START domain
LQATKVSRHVNAPAAVVYRALLDPDAIVQWRVPDGMTSHVHHFDPHEGGTFRVTLTYEASQGAGKSSAHSDTYRGHFARLVPNSQVVEVLEFETPDPELHGIMTMTTTLVERGGGTDVVIQHDGLPDAVPAADNETGTRMALAHLARLVETPRRHGPAPYDARRP